MADKNEFLRDKPKSGNTREFYVFLYSTVLFLVMLIGCWVSTQYFAFLVHYDPKIVGYPFYVTKSGYPLYLPWMYFSWLLENVGNIQLTALLRQAIFAWAFVCGGSLFLYVIFTALRTLKSKAENLYGTARRATEKELKKYGLFTGIGTVMGETHDAKLKIIQNKNSTALKLLSHSQLITQQGNGSVLTIAPPRSYKGVSIGIPTHLNHKGHLFSFDVKGESYDYTSGFRRKFSRVLRWAPASDDSVSFNFLLSIRSGDDAWDDALMLATTALAPGTEGKEDENQAHFRIAATDFLAGLCLHVLCSSYHDKSMGGVLDFISGTQSGGEDENNDKTVELLQSMIDAEHCSDQIHEQVCRVARRQLTRPSRERGSVFSSVFKALSVFESPRVRRNTSRQDFTYEDFINSETPISLYMTVSNAKLEQLSILVRLFVSMMLRRFTDGETKYDDVALKQELLFILDEFTSLKAFSFLQQAMAIVPGFGIKFLLICQSYSQLDSVYGRNHQFFGLCKHVVVYAPGDYQSAELFCKMMGKESVWKTSASYSGNRNDIVLKNLNSSGSEVERNLMNPDELMKLPFDSCLIFTQGMPVYLAKKVVYYEDKRFKNRAALPGNPDSTLIALRTKASLLNEAAPLRKLKTAQDWFELPLFTCLEKLEDIEYAKELIDSRFAAVNLAEKAANIQNNPQHDASISSLLVGV